MNSVGSETKFLNYPKITEKLARSTKLILDFFKLDFYNSFRIPFSATEMNFRASFVLSNLTSV